MTRPTGQSGGPGIGPLDDREQLGEGDRLVLEPCALSRRIASCTDERQLRVRVCRQLYGLAVRCGPCFNPATGRDELVLVPDWVLNLPTVATIAVGTTCYKLLGDITEAEARELFGIPPGDELQVITPQHFYGAFACSSASVCDPVGGGIPKSGDQCQAGETWPAPDAQETDPGSGELFGCFRDPVLTGDDRTCVDTAEVTVQHSGSLSSTNDRDSAAWVEDTSGNVFGFNSSGSSVTGGALGRFLVRGRFEVNRDGGCICGGNPCPWIRTELLELQGSWSASVEKLYAEEPGTPPAPCSQGASGTIDLETLNGPADDSRAFAQAVAQFHNAHAPWGFRNLEPGPGPEPSGASAGGEYFYCTSYDCDRDDAPGWVSMSGSRVLPFPIYPELQQCQVSEGACELAPCDGPSTPGCADSAFVSFDEFDSWECSRGGVQLNTRRGFERARVSDLGGHHSFQVFGTINGQSWRRSDCGTFSGGVWSMGDSSTECSLLQSFTKRVRTKWLCAGMVVPLEREPVGAPARRLTLEDLA